MVVVVVVVVAAAAAVVVVVIIIVVVRATRPIRARTSKFSRYELHTVLQSTAFQNINGHGFLIRTILGTILNYKRAPGVHV